MDSLGLVVRDDETFLTKVVNSGMEQGIFTRDRSDEIIRISVAMANKYVLQKEVDFRSEEELGKVQETILKLVGVGLEIKSGGNVEHGIRLIMEMSPVFLFRLAFTRIEKLRNRWQRLLLDHRVEILVSSEEFECLSDLTCQRLSEMSVFAETEIYTIRSITLEDELFSTLGMIEYYESELERYEFIVRLKDILPFKLLNKSPNVRAENLSEVDSIREALVNTLVISAYVDAPDPVSLKMEEVRHFLAGLDPLDVEEPFPQDLEDVMLDVIQEVGEGLDEREGSLLAKEIIHSVQKLVETVNGEWDTVNSSSENTFFKRWSRLVILSDAPDSLMRILSTGGVIDEFDFEVLLGQLSARPETDALQIIERMPWLDLTPSQVIRIFHHVRPYQLALAEKVNLAGFSNPELIDFLEGVNPEVFKALIPALKRVFSDKWFTLEELELLGALPHTDTARLLKMANPPEDYDLPRIVAEFREGSQKVRRIILYSCWGSEFFPDLFVEAWSVDAGLVKKLAKSVRSGDIGAFLSAAAGQSKPTVSKEDDREPELVFPSAELNALFNLLPKSKKRAAVRFFLPPNEFTQ
ncbi:MAG: DUF6178 family protein [Desulfomonile sp.]|nr:DUF6178 family protein [Deltaproteobacteria bacterium]